MNTSLSVSEMRKDVKYVKRKLFKMHPDVDLYISKKDLNKKFDSLNTTINSPLKPNEFFLKIAPVVASVKQGHMSMGLLSEEIEKKDKKKYKGSTSPFSQLDFIWNNNQLYIEKNNSKNKAIKPGTAVVAINGITPQSYYQKYRSSLTSDGFNTTFIEPWFGKKISTYYLAELGIQDSIILKLNCNDSIFTQTVYRNFKTQKKQTIPPKDSITEVKKDTVPQKKKVLTKIEKKELNDSLKAISKNRQIFGYNSKTKQPIISLNYPTQDSTFAVLKITSFTKTKYKKAYELIFEEIKNKNIQNLVLDLRGNTGGRLNEIGDLYAYLTTEPSFIFLDETKVSAKWSLPFYMNTGHSLLHYTLFSPSYIIQTAAIILHTKKDKNGNYYYKLKFEKEKPRKDNNYAGQLYVFTDGLTFSAAAIISSNLKGSHRATFIGNETGGTYNGTVAGRLPVLTLPKSKLKWKVGLMSIKPKYQTEEIGRGVQPDIEIIPTAEQIINQEDLEMNYLLDQLGLKHKD